LVDLQHHAFGDRNKEKKKQRREEGEEENTRYVKDYFLLISITLF
jgi:hypothetical protein